MITILGRTSSRPIEQCYAEVRDTANDLSLAEGTWARG